MGHTEKREGNKKKFNRQNDNDKASKVILPIKLH